MSSPTDSLEALIQSRKTGNEKFRSDAPLEPFPLIEFWQWGSSDLISNATRGRLAEFLVAKALGVAEGIRTEWDAFDFLLPSGVKVEVKSCGYLQSWRQLKLSPISFKIRPTRAWNEAARSYAPDPMRQADLYIFALLAHQDKSTVDALDIDQWHFYVVPTSRLNTATQANSINLRTIQSLCPKQYAWHELRDAVAAITQTEGTSGS
jgi:hypothetical protein